MQLSPATPADLAAVTELVVATESAFYGASTFTQADLEDEWSELDVVLAVRDGDRVVGYGAIRRRAEQPWSVEGHVHPDAAGRGIGRLLATGLEAEAARGGASQVHSTVFEVDTAARALLESLGYRAVRVFREMRIELGGPPPAPEWPAGLRMTSFDPERDARAVHAAHQEAFADAWDFSPMDFGAWCRRHMESDRYDPSLWGVVRAGDEVAAGTISTGGTYGGGFVHAVFTRRPWRKKGVGAALLADALARLHASGEREVGLGVDAASETGAFRLYERAGMKPALGWVVYEKDLIR